MFLASPDLPKKSLQIEQDDKFFSRLMSRESSLANPSLRVYHGGIPSSVPFEWESQPGTPKHTFSETTIPPLTPPPSYYSRMLSKNPFNKKRSKPNLIRALFPKTNTAKKDIASSSSPTSSPPSDPRSTVRIIRCRQQKRQRKNSSSSSSDSSGDDDHQEQTLCFCIGRLNSTSSTVLRSSHDHEW